MRVQSGTTKDFLFYLLIVIEIIFLVLILSSNHYDISFDNEPIDTLNDNWNYTDNAGTEHVVKLPAKLSIRNDNTIVLSRVLPTKINFASTLANLSSHNSIQAYIDNELIYSYKKESNHIFDLTPGMMWNIIKLPEDAAGKNLTLIFATDHRSSKVINEVYIGTKAAFLIHILHSRVLNVIMSFTILLIGLILLVVYLFLIKFLKKNKSILYLSIFSILTSLWMITESDMTQLFMDNRYFISSLKYLSLMTLPIPMLLYISMIVNDKFKKLTLYFKNLFIGNVFIMLILQFLNIMNFRDGLFILHILLVVIFSIVFYILCWEVFKVKNKSLQSLIVSFGFLFFFSMIEVYSYNTQIVSSTGTFLQLGVLLFMIIVSWNSLQKAVGIVRLSEDASHYEYLASIDYMTKCKNRTAYSMEIDNISLDQEIAIIMTDVNNMKYTNDTYGHHAGDAVIIRSSQCLMNLFGDTGLCYRIGGDEFVCIEYNQDKSVIEDKIAAFINDCKTTNSICAYQFEVSVGYAFYDSNLDKDIYDTVRRADKNMYLQKIDMKTKV